MKRKYLEFTKPKTVLVSEEDFLTDEIGDEEIAGKTLCTMISAGTEIHSSYLDVFNWGYPKKSGYTAVFQVEKKGSKVEGIEIGDRVFVMGVHQSHQCVNYKEAVKIPANVSAQSALFVRMAGVSMATLSKTQIKSGEKVLVTGLGPVGLMAMFAYSNLGYEVIGVDPDENRRQIARSKGFCVFDKVPSDDKRYAKQIALALECSGNENAVLDCCNMVRVRGEVSVVGVPWKQCSDLSAYTVLHSVFYNYVNLYSGWELDLPRINSWNVHESMKHNYELMLKMISDGKVDTDGLYAERNYTEAQQAFDDIYNKQEKHLATIFLWN